VLTVWHFDERILWFELQVVGFGLSRQYYNITFRKHFAAYTCLPGMWSVFLLWWYDNIVGAKHPYNDTRNILYNIACGVQVPAPAPCGTAWSDCVVTLAGRSSAVRLDPYARRLRIPFACRGICKFAVGKYSALAVRIPHTSKHTPRPTRYRCTPKFSCRSKSPRVPVEISFSPYARKV